jgi:hypothetical protein
MAVLTTYSLIATSDGLRRPGDDGATCLAGEAVTAVHTDDAGLWVITDHRHLHRITGGAAERVASLDGDARATCLTTHGGTVWIGGDEARLWRLDGRRLDEVQSFRTAPTQPEWHTPWGGPPAVIAMASDGADLYVAVHVGGILRSADGTSWTPTIDLHVDVHQVALGPDGTVWAATGARGLAESGDRGATWRYHTAGLHATYLLAVAVVDGGVLVGASSGHAGRDGAVYRFDAGGFTRSGGLPSRFDGAVSPRHLAADGEHAVVALPHGDVYASHDGGRVWASLATGLPGVAGVALVSRARADGR